MKIDLERRMSTDKNCSSSKPASGLYQIADLMFTDKQ